MKRKIISLITIIMVGNFTGCSVKECNPSKVGFVDGIYCNVSGRYDDRLLILSKRLEVTKQEYIGLLVKYQEVYSDVTDDNHLVLEYKNRMEKMYSEANILEGMRGNIETKEEKKYFIAQAIKLLKTLNDLSSYTHIEQNKVVVNKEHMAKLKRLEAKLDNSSTEMITVVSMLKNKVENS